MSAPKFLTRRDFKSQVRLSWLLAKTASNETLKGRVETALPSLTYVISGIFRMLTMGYGMPRCDRLGPLLDAADESTTVELPSPWWGASIAPAGRSER